MMLRLTINTRRKSLAHYADQIQVSNAYNRQAKKCHSEFTVLNFTHNFGKNQRKTARTNYLLFLKLNHASHEILQVTSSFLSNHGYL